MIKGIYILSGIMILLLSPCIGQVDCNTLDINKASGKMIWQDNPRGEAPVSKTQWQLSEPIRKELQRIMPLALDGLYATNSIAFSDGKAFWNGTGPAAYENYLMLKKFECLKGRNILQPEGETGCWVYFSINRLEGVKFPLPEQGTDVLFNETRLRVTNIETKTDAAGNKILYCSYRPEEIIKHCYFFSNRKGLPWRRLTNKELYSAYRIHHDKRVAGQILKFEKLVDDDEKKYAGLSEAEKKEQNYWPKIIQQNKEYLKKYKDEKQKINAWFLRVMQQSDLDKIAEVERVSDTDFYPDKLRASPGKAYNVWVDNLDYFDPKLPKDQPQCIAVYIRKQDTDLPKKNFMNLFCSQFNLDVIAKIVGENPKLPSSLNTINASDVVAKEATKTNQNTAFTYSYNFANSTVNQFPANWNGMKNATIQPFNSKNWMAFASDSYCYPRQYNKEIGDGFSLSFDLAWNPDIAYNSGLFTVTLGDVEYDNSSEAYKLDDNQKMYWSLYDGYAGNFNRVICWFDPYWNGGGTLTIYSYNKNETIVFNKRITLPDFYLTKNNHKVILGRKGNSLLVDIDGRREAEWNAVFMPSVKYNLCTFSRYKGNNSDNKKDVFYLNNITLNY